MTAAHSDIVKAVQAALASGGYYTAAIDGDLGPMTVAGFERLRKAARTIPAPIDYVATSPISTAMRRALFGSFTWKPNPATEPGQDIEIQGDWELRNIVTIDVNKGPVKRASVHRLIVWQFVNLFRAWEKAGLLPLVLTWEGAFNARYIRGSKTSLSNHAYGTAFDINAAWNGLGATPAKAGAKGSVRELLPLAEKFGFYWGGNFARKDGMHFEANRVLSIAEQRELEGLL